MKMRAKENLIGDGKVYITMGKEYEIQKDRFNFTMIDNYGEEQILTEEAIKYKFEKSE